MISEFDSGFYEPAAGFTPPAPGNSAERLARLRLIRSRRVGPATFRRLMAEHGTAAAALAALPGVASAAGVAEYSPCSERAALAEMKAAKRAGAQMLCLGDANYPALLAATPDAPPVLWALGDAALLARPMLAMVGTRNASSLGARMTRRLAADLAQAGFVVVSGLARGIDALAHTAALDGGTIGVQAGGLDVVYPAENTDLARLMATRGLRLSEQPFGLQPQARHFPRRNRIVSGLAAAVVVIEAAARSGSLITARLALDQGREVMAVPGHPMDTRASGCNILIRDGATLVRGAEDVIAALGPQAAVPHQPSLPLTEAAAPARSPRGPAPARGAASAPQSAAAPNSPPARPGAPAAQTVPVRGPAPARGAATAPRPAAAPDTTAPPPDAPPDATAPDTAALPGRILDLIGPAPVPEDQLIRDLGLPPHRVTPLLAEMELSGRLERRPGGMLARAG